MDAVHNYIDDVLSLGRSTSLDHVKAVLGAIIRTGLTAKLNPSKCQWGAHSLTYLGYEVYQKPVSRLKTTEY